MWDVAAKRSAVLKGNGVVTWLGWPSGVGRIKDTDSASGYVSDDHFVETSRRLHSKGLISASEL